jgi:hypothetical protein
MLPTRFIFSQKAKQQTDFTADGVLRQFLQSGNDIAKKCTRKVRGIKLPEKIEAFLEETSNLKIF